MHGRQKHRGKRKKIDFSRNTFFSAVPSVSSAVTIPKDNTIWLDLPFELLLYIFSFLEAKDLLVMTLVCSVWNAAATDNNLWFKFFLPNVYDAKLSYKNLYFQRKPDFTPCSFFDNRQRLLRGDMCVITFLRDKQRQLHCLLEFWRETNIYIVHNRIDEKNKLHTIYSSLREAQKLVETKLYSTTFEYPIDPFIIIKTLQGYSEHAQNEVSEGGNKRDIDLLYDLLTEATKNLRFLNGMVLDNFYAAFIAHEPQAQPNMPAPKRHHCVIS